jgi:hypothetical protein
LASSSGFLQAAALLDVNLAAAELATVLAKRKS